MTLIGIAGKAGSGKTSAAEVFETYGYAKVAFADPLKWVAQTYFFWDGKKDERGRRLLQQLGTDVGRAYDKDLWVKHMEKTLEAKMKVMQNNFQECKIVIHDVRFPNETDLIRSLGGIVVHLTTKGYDMGELSNHESEQILEIKPNDVILDLPRFNSKERFMDEFEIAALEAGLIKE